MTKYNFQVQNFFLSEVRQKHKPVEILLDSGSIVRGRITNYDQFSVTLTFSGKSEIIYKSSILYIKVLPKKKKKKKKIDANIITSTKNQSSIKPQINSKNIKISVNKKI